MKCRRPGFSRNVNGIEHQFRNRYSAKAAIISDSTRRIAIASRPKTAHSINKHAAIGGTPATSTKVRNIEFSSCRVAARVSKKRKIQLAESAAGVLNARRTASSEKKLSVRGIDTTASRITDEAVR